MYAADSQLLLLNTKPLSTAEAVATTGVVCVLCSFTAGLLLGALLTQCHGHCHRKGKRGQTEIPPVYEDIPLEKTPHSTEHQ